MFYLQCLLWLQIWFVTSCSEFYLFHSQGLFLPSHPPNVYLILSLHSQIHIYALYLGELQKRGGRFHFPTHGWGIVNRCLVLGKRFLRLRTFFGQGVRIHPTVIKYPYLCYLSNVYLSQYVVMTTPTVMHPILVFLLHAKRGWLRMYRTVNVLFLVYKRNAVYYLTTWTRNNGVCTFLTRPQSVHTHFRYLLTCNICLAINYRILAIWNTHCRIFTL